MAKFANEGWEFYEKMLDINPSSAARGDFAFSPLMGESAETAAAALDDARLEQGIADITMDDASGLEDAGDHEDVTLVDKASSKPSMKRKAMNPPETIPRTTSAPRSGAPTSSGVSTAASTATSSKRRRTGKQEGPSSDVFLHQLLN